MKASSTLVFKTQDIGNKLTLRTVEVLPEPKTAVPSQPGCHAFMFSGTASQAYHMDRHRGRISDVSLATRRICRERHRPCLSNDQCSCRLNGSKSKQDCGAVSITVRL